MNLFARFVGFAFTSTTAMTELPSALSRPSENVSRTELEIELEIELKELYYDLDYAKGDLVTYFSMRDSGRISRKQYLEGLTD